MTLSETMLKALRWAGDRPAYSSFSFDVADICGHRKKTMGALLRREMIVGVFVDGKGWTDRFRISDAGISELLRQDRAATLDHQSKGAE